MLTVYVARVLKAVEALDGLEDVPGGGFERLRET